MANKYIDEVSSHLAFSGEHSQLIADTMYAYTRSPDKYVVSAGTNIHVAGGQFYEVAESGASDEHYTTAGGVKLYEAGPSFSSRARLLDWSSRLSASGAALPDGQIFSDGAVRYVASGGATDISDLPGLVPFGYASNLHWSENATPGTTDVTNSIQSALSYGGDVRIQGGTLLVTKASLEALAQFGLVPASGSRITQDLDSKIILEAGVDVRHVIAGGAGDDNIHWENFIFDGQDSACNGIGCSGVDGWSITGKIQIENITSAEQETGASVTVLGGGRGITFQGGSTNINIGVINAKSCFQVLDLTGKPSNANFTNSCVGINAEDCDVVFAAVGTDQQGEVGGFDNSGVYVGFINFKNCGKSSQDNRINFSWVREDSAGNNWPWQAVDRPGTTYTGADYPWAIESFNGGDAEWDYSASYSIADRVKTTNNGEYSSIICVSHAGGVTIGSVRGRNDAGYTTSGFIGALLWGMGKNAVIQNVDIDCDVRHAVRCGANPYIGILTRPDEMCENISIRGYRNIGVTEVVVDSDGPISTSQKYGVPGLMLTGIEVMQTGNSDIVGDNLRDEPGSASDRGYRGWIEVYNLENGGRISGFTDQVGRLSLSDVSAGFSGGDKVIQAGAMHVSVYQSTNQLIIERTGSSAGKVFAWMNGDDFQFGSSAGVAQFQMELDTGDLRILTDGSGVWLKQPDGDSSELTVDNSGRLLIDGTVVGTQT